MPTGVYDRTKTGQPEAGEGTNAAPKKRGRKPRAPKPDPEPDVHELFAVLEIIPGGRAKIRAIVPEAGDSVKLADILRERFPARDFQATGAEFYEGGLDQVLKALEPQVSKVG